jgi:hypothetical protein
MGGVVQLCARRRDKISGRPYSIEIIGSFPVVGVSVKRSVVKRLVRNLQLARIFALALAARAHAANTAAHKMSEIALVMRENCLKPFLIMRSLPLPLQVLAACFW